MGRIGIAWEMQAENHVWQTMSTLRCGGKSHLAAAIDSVVGPFEAKRDGIIARDNATQCVFEVTHIKPAQAIPQVAESAPCRVGSQQESRDFDAAGCQHENIGPNIAKMPALR